MVPAVHCRTGTVCPRFLTLKTIESLPVFSQPPVTYILLDVLEFLQHHERLRLYAYVIMENHIHLIASSPSLASEIGDFAAFTTGSVVSYLQAKNARSILMRLEQFRTNGTVPLWQSRWQTEQIGNSEALHRVVDHVHHNPVRRGYVDHPCHWRYSSARNYAGQPGLLEVFTDWE